MNFTTQCGENRHTDIANFATFIHTKKNNTPCGESPSPGKKEGESPSPGKKKGESPSPGKKEGDSPRERGAIPGEGSD